MHELGIVFHVIKSVEKIGEENGLTNVASVTLELGEVSGAIPHELESCWNWAVKRTELLPEAALKIETIPEPRSPANRRWHWYTCASTGRCPSANWAICSTR